MLWDACCHVSTCLNTGHVAWVMCTTCSCVHSRGKFHHGDMEDSGWLGRGQLCWKMFMAARGPDPNASGIMPPSRTLQATPHARVAPRNALGAIQRASDVAQLQGRARSSARVQR